MISSYNLDYWKAQTFDENQWVQTDFETEKWILSVGTRGNPEASYISGNVHKVDNKCIDFSHISATSAMEFLHIIFAMSNNSQLLLQ